MSERKLVTLSSQIPVIFAILSGPNAPERVEVPTVWFKEYIDKGADEPESLLGSMIFILKNFDTYFNDDPIISMQFYCRNHYLMIEEK